MTVHVLTSRYAGYVPDGVRRPVFDKNGHDPTRVVEDPYRELCAQLIKTAKDAIEDLTNIADRVSINPKTKEEKRQYIFFVKPVVQVLGWLADPYNRGTNFVSLASCCEYTNLQTDVVSSCLVALLRKIPPNGLRAISYYIARLDADSHFARQHYQLVGRKDKTHD